MGKKIKISIGSRLQSGPFGGGNQFAHGLSEFLQRHGIEVSFDLSRPDLDLILLTEPRKGLAICAYDERDILKYILKTNPRALVVQRINECDERKGTTSVNRKLMWANQIADHTVFISRWLHDLFVGNRLHTGAATVVHNGADQRVFNTTGYHRWAGQGKLRIVTHHWGAIWMKGFDVYKALDSMLGDHVYKDQIEFTFIGNVPAGFTFKNAKHVPPLAGGELAAEIKKSHVYLTASQNEPAGMHHIEGAMCGLPLLYRESGALPEYCKGFGIGFDVENFEQKLNEMMQTSKLK